MLRAVATRVRRLAPMSAILPALVCSPLAAQQLEGDPVTEQLIDAADPAAERWVEATLAELGLRERIAQLILAWIPGGEIPAGTDRFERLIRWIESDQVGGLIVSRGPVDEFAPFLNQLQARSRVPLLIVSDLETGPGMRLTGGTNMPPAMAFAAAGNLELARQAGLASAREGRAAGIHLTLGPVLDVNSNPYNPIINTRSFGEDPRRVAEMASAWIEGARSGGLQVAGKHFPGHGATEVDSHVGLPTISSSVAELHETELVPFRVAIQQGMDGVLVGHIAVPAIDGPAAPPASLSPAIVSDLLRRQLGFEGLIITDALNMGAIVNHYGVPEASILALQAGADLLLQPPDHGEVIDAIAEAVRRGRLSEERITESVRRVLTAKVKAGLHRNRFAPGGAAEPAHQRIAAEVIASAITLVKDDRELVPIPADATRIVHVTFSLPGNPFSGSTLATALLSAGHPVETVRMGPGTQRGEYEVARLAAQAADLTLVSISMSPRQSQGALDLPPAFIRFVEGLSTAGVPMVTISFGTPYVLGSLPGVPTQLLAWTADPQAQEAVAAALLGQAPVQGRLPVSLPPEHKIGSGIPRPAQLGESGSS